jgi:regulator of protease activity HflC (stomatin/prohibitin superfamily)
MPTTTQYIAPTPSVGGGSLRGLGWFLFITGIIGLLVTIFVTSLGAPLGLEAWFGIQIILGFILMGLYIIPEWIRTPTLLLGRYRAMRGPGIFWLFPLFYSIPFALDIRIITTSFSAESTLTKDNVPVNVDAVLFWQVVDPFKAAIHVQDYKNAIGWAAQTSLRDIIGRSDLSEMLSDRERLARELQATIDTHTEEWGVNSKSVEIRDVVIPAGLQDAMSRQAQAERERQARVILASSEEQIAQKFVNAAGTYEQDEIALNLRAMNILYESMKEKGAWVIVPTELADIIGATPQRVLAKRKAAEAGEVAAT